MEYFDWIMRTTLQHFYLLIIILYTNTSQNNNNLTHESLQNPQPKQ